MVFVQSGDPISCYTINTMKLLFAQGNPGEDYDRTRHNVGFTIVDEFAKQHESLFQAKSKFKALVAECLIDEEKVLLVKPMTYYNDTGESARALIDFYKLDPASDLLVIHDELALPFGTLRSRERGRDAGNNGVKSLNAHIGENFKRLRVGIGSEQREVMGDTAFVLGQFTEQETTALPELIKKAHQVCGAFIANTFPISTV